MWTALKSTRLGRLAVGLQHVGSVDALAELTGEIGQVSGATLRVVEESSSRLKLCSCFFPGRGFLTSHIVQTQN